VKIGMYSGTSDRNHAFTVAVIDGPYDAAALSGVLANGPVSLADGSCGADPNSACEHGTFILGLLGARQDSLIPGLCPDCRLVHIPLFVDAHSPSASVDELAAAIAKAVSAGARLINLSLAILGDEQQNNARLAAALDFAAASGAVLVVAAGNQGRLAMGQLLSHPVVIPVVAADASQSLLPESNFGPAIFRHGVAALGRVPGYAPGGGITVMSGTSVATAVATGILADIWSEHPDIDGATLRSAVADLGPRSGSKPPILNRDLVAAALDQMVSTAIAAAGAVEMTSHVRLQGATTMGNGNGQPVLAQGSGPVARPAQTVTPAGGGCGCGAPAGVCSCGAENDLSGFVYAIGTIEADYPYVAIEREMQLMADRLGVAPPGPNLTTRPTEDRDWQYQVLSRDRKKTRWLARQLRWRLTIEDLPVFVLSPSDPNYYDDLIDALNRTKYSKPARPTVKRKAKQAVPIETDTDRVVDVDVVIGVAGPQTPDGIAVVMDQLFQVDRGQLAPDGLADLPQFADNRGLADEERVRNFLAARYRTPPSHLGGYALSGMRVAPSRLGSGSGRIMKAVYTYRNTAADEKELFVRVDVTHEFPMIVSPIQPYLEKGEKT
jgi:Subtilase family/PatG C-terminal/PatG Domain